MSWKEMTDSQLTTAVEGALVHIEEMQLLSPFGIAAVREMMSRLRNSIPSPTITVEIDRGYPTLFVNGVWVATSQDDKRMDCDKWNEQNMLCEKSRLTKALGLEEVKQ